MTQILGWLTCLTGLGLILSLAWRRLMGRQWLVTAPVAFIAYQSVNVFGVATESRYDDGTFQFLWPFMVLMAFGMFVVGAIAASRLQKFDPAIEVPRWRNQDLIDDMRSHGTVVLLFVLAILSIGVGVVFARSVGYNTFLQGLSEYFTNRSVDAGTISELRADATRGGYRALGYVTQFTGFILPGIAILLYVMAKQRGTTLPKFVALGIALVDFYFVTIVGGRVYLIGGVAMAALLLLGPTSPLPKAMRKRGGSAALLVLLGLALFGFSTVLQGRGGIEGQASVAQQATVGLYDRLGGDYSAVQIEAIGILRPEAPVMGKQWVDQLKSALPGVDQGLPFDRRVHGLVFNGNTNGNMPLDPWGSYYYNFGIAGMVAIPFLLGFALQSLSIKYLIRGGRGLSTVVLLSLACYRFVFLLDPYSILLTGPVTFAIFLYLVRRTQNKDQESGAIHAPRTAADSRGGTSPRISRDMGGLSQVENVPRQHKETR